MPFLSPPSARRATHRIQVQLRQLPISIPALREEGDSHRQPLMAPSSYFYPRPPRGGRQRGAHYAKRRIEFLSPPSARRATTPSSSLLSGSIFLSPPSARRATSRRSWRSSKGRNFYPRPPRGGRPSGSSDTISVELFLSPPSARRATFVAEQRSCPPATYFYPRPPRGGRHGLHERLQSGFRISIPALREEGDSPKAAA